MARMRIPKIAQYPGGQVPPTPKAIRLQSRRVARFGDSGCLGLARYLKAWETSFVVTSAEAITRSSLEAGRCRQSHSAAVSGRVSDEREKWPLFHAKKLKLAITAGIALDHVDLESAIARGIITVRRSEL